MLFPKKKPIINTALMDEVRTQGCVACGQTPGDLFNPIEVHHVTCVSQGRRDTEENLMGLCRKCHAVWHSESRSKMVLRNPGVYSWLTRHNREDVIARAIIRESK